MVFLITFPPFSKHYNAQRYLLLPFCNRFFYSYKWGFVNDYYKIYTMGQWGKFLVIIIWFTGTVWQTVLKFNETWVSQWKIYYYSIEINFLGGEHKVMTLKQQFLGIILCTFIYLKWLWLLCFFAKNAVEAI